MEIESWESSSDENLEVDSQDASEVDSQDASDDDLDYALDKTPQLQIRKVMSKARWDAKIGMAEIIERKGTLWTTTGIMRKSKLYCFIEEIMFLVQVGALLLLDVNDTILSLGDLYEMAAKENNGCSWELCEAYRHLKSFGYIVGRYGIPWTKKSDKRSCHSPSRDINETNGVSDQELEDDISILNLLRDMKINEVKPALDVYLPNKKFKKTSPGIPIFILCLTRGHPPSKVEIEDLERMCNGVPLKFGHVEPGHVSLFSFNKTELPVLP